MNSLTTEEIKDNSIYFTLSTISILEHDKKEFLFNNLEIKQAITLKLFQAIEQDIYRGMDRVLYNISILDLVKLMDYNTFKSFFKGNIERYKFFASLPLKNTKLIEYYLENDEWFNEFLLLNDYYYSSFAALSYDIFKKIILKIDNGNYDFRNDFISSMPDEFIKQIIKENISLKSLIWILKASSNDILNDFFQNDERAIMVYKEFYIRGLIGNGITFSNEILKEDYFFEQLKSSGFVVFRELINKLERTNNIDIIDEHVQKYHTELLNSILSNGLFKDYDEILNNPNIMKEKFKIPFLFDDDVKSLFKKHFDYDRNNEPTFYNIEELIQKLQQITRLKTTEVICDILFKDNYYNVILNIKEILRYNSKLEQSVIPIDRIYLYQTILNFDKISIKDKMDICNRYVNANISEFFYDDIRTLKDLSYKEIQNSLFSTTNNKENKIQNNIKVYDLRDKEFTMLIRGIKKFSPINNHQRNCYSIISNENTSAYGDKNYLFYYGYNSFEIENVSHVLEMDSFSADLKDESPSHMVNRIMSPREITNNSFWYSEFDIINELDENGEYISKKPDFLVVYDEIEDKHLYEAERLNIPIVLIKSRKLDEKNKTNIPLNQFEDIYVHNEYGEETLQKGR